MSGHTLKGSAPRPDALLKFLDHPIIASRPMQPPPFQPVKTLRGGSGGGFGTGGGFGSTGGFHTMRLAPWEEPSIVALDPHAPPVVENIMPQNSPAPFAPSTCAPAAAHAVNCIRAEQSGDRHLKAVANAEAAASILTGSGGDGETADGSVLVMRPERFAFLQASYLSCAFSSIRFSL